MRHVPLHHIPLRLAEAVPREAALDPGEARRRGDERETRIRSLYRRVVTMAMLVS